MYCVRARARRFHIVLTTMSQYTACDATQKRQQQKNTVRRLTVELRLRRQRITKTAHAFHFVNYPTLHHESESFCCFCSFFPIFFFFRVAFVVLFLIRLLQNRRYMCSMFESHRVQVDKHTCVRHARKRQENSARDREMSEKRRTVSAIAYVIYVFFVLEKRFVLCSSMNNDNAECVCTARVRLPFIHWHWRTDEGYGELKASSRRRQRCY